eukprot:CAMPEP_0196574940 /NCGR_PEP_ID=MMETSP1081-20130531/4533_1 /TAXON_ID=36882 /ORGANISM="Pyramimonas amylifera, Strain CCMP720" /LENGTH=378 /DNA_ID=CAMNT_0041893089 /DNA_START=21 /DNA_END=1157 /DNA_ORIENTATION=+
MSATASKAEISKVDYYGEHHQFAHQPQGADLDALSSNDFKKDAKLSVMPTGLHISARQDSWTINFRDITKSWVHESAYLVEGHWSGPGPSVHAFLCGASVAREVQASARQAVTARFQAIQHELNEKDTIKARVTERPELKGKPLKAGKGGKFVLLVEPNERLQKLNEQVLKTAGQVALIVNNPYEALDVYEDSYKSISIILTEINLLGDMSGWDLTREVRKREREQGRTQVPVFALTGLHYDYTSEDLRATNTIKSSNLCHSEAAGMNGYMMKPATKYKLRNLLLQHLNSKMATCPRTHEMLEESKIMEYKTAEDNVDEALEAFYAKESSFHRLLLLPFWLARKYFKFFYWALGLMGIQMNQSSYERIFTFPSRRLEY